MTNEAKARLAQLLQAGWSVKIEPIRLYPGVYMPTAMITLVAPFRLAREGDSSGWKNFTVGEETDVLDIESGLESAINGAYAIAFPAQAGSSR